MLQFYTYEIAINILEVHLPYNDIEQDNGVLTFKDAHS